MSPAVRALSYRDKSQFYERCTGTLDLEEEANKGEGDMQHSKVFSSKLIFQYAPEVTFFSNSTQRMKLLECGTIIFASLIAFIFKVLDELNPQFTHLSDLWAAGILILWSVLLL